MSDILTNAEPFTWHPSIFYIVYHYNFTALKNYYKTRIEWIENVLALGNVAYNIGGKTLHQNLSIIIYLYYVSMFSEYYLIDHFSNN